MADGQPATHERELISFAGVAVLTHAGLLRNDALYCAEVEDDLMREYLKFYIDGGWVDPVELRTIDVENPANEQVCGRIAIRSSADVDHAVAAARAAFANWSPSSSAG